MQGIQSLHGWMSAASQFPSPKFFSKVKKKSKIVMEEDDEVLIQQYKCFILYVFISKQEEEPEVTIKLTAVNPQKLQNVVRFDFNKMEFIPPKSKIYDLS